MPIAFVFHIHLSHTLVFQDSQWKTTGKLIYISPVLTHHDVMLLSLEKHICISFVFNHHDVSWNSYPWRVTRFIRNRKKCIEWQQGIFLPVLIRHQVSITWLQAFCILPLGLAPSSLHGSQSFWHSIFTIEPLCIITDWKSLCNKRRLNYN